MKGLKQPKIHIFWYHTWYHTISMKYRYRISIRIFRPFKYRYHISNGIIGPVQYQYRIGIEISVLDGISIVSVSKKVVSKGSGQGLQSFYTFGRYYKALQPLLLALFVQTISQPNIRRSVSQGKNDQTGRNCNCFFAVSYS